MDKAGGGGPALLWAMRGSESPFGKTDPLSRNIPASQAAPAQQFGPCEIRSSEIELLRDEPPLGVGAFGTVYRGKVRGQMFAVKVLKNVNKNKNLVDAFKKELSFLSQLFHPNICLFVGACLEPGHTMLVAELMDMDLEKLLFDKEAHITEFTLIRMMRDAAKGMAWLHAVNVFHRDFKPANCLLDRHWNVKICDFGLSQILPEDSTVRDGEGVAQGSPLWMAPEVLSGGNIGAAADMYSFGISLWQCMTRKRPFANVKNITELKQNVCVHSRRPPLPENVDPSIQQLTQDCWNPAPKMRPKFSEVVSRMDDILIHLAVKDKQGAEFWKREFAGQQVVPFKAFYQKLEAFFGDNNEELTDSNEAAAAQREGCVRALFRVDEQSNLLDIETFGKMLAFVGPLSAGFPARVASLMAKAWFHGTVDTHQAEDALRDRAPGTFLIRYSNRVPGQFTITKLDTEGKPLHKRIERSEDSMLLINGAAYNSLEELVVAEWKQLNLLCSAPGSPYQSLFEKKGKPNYEHAGTDSYIESLGEAEI